MNDDSMIKVMQTLGLNYNPAIDSTMQFQKTVADLNKQLESMKKIAMDSAKDVNNAFSSQLGQMNVSALREMNKFYANLEKQNKPIEVKVETDKAEIAMQEFAKSMGIKLDKNLREQFQGLASSMTDGFDEKQFTHLGERIGVAFGESMNKEHRRLSKEAIADTEEAYRYLIDYFKGGKAIDLKLGSTQQVITEVDGFKEAMRGIAPIANDGSVSLDNLKTDMQQLGAFASQNIDSYEGFATALTKVVQEYRQFKATGKVEGVDPMAMMGKDINQLVETELMKLTTELGKIQYESKQTANSLEEVSSVKMESLKNEVQGLGVVTTKTFADMNNEVYKYIDTYKNLEKGINISDTYMKNDMGGFDFSGRIVNDKSVETTYRSIQKAHAEALELNVAFDDTIAKNQQMAKDNAWKQQFQSVTATSDEMKELNNYYAELEKHGKANIKTIKESNLEQMKAKAASVQQRASAKGLNQEYVEQAGVQREQLSTIQSRLQMEGKLTGEEIRQTQELKEQLDILDAKSKTDAWDSKRLNPSDPANALGDKASWFTDGAKFYAVSRAAKQATETIKDVEMGMVEIARVMNDSSFVFDDYRDRLLKFGVDYGQTFDNVQSVALRWAQSGYNVADSLTLTETSLLALNTAELDATNATESMIGIMAQWQLQAEDLALVMDKVNKTADNYSVTSQDLVDGLLRSSGAAKVMGMSLDDTIATLTVLREASGRTGKEVGNALSSILSYIQRPKSIDVMESLGIKMFADEARTEFRNVMEIFEELSQKWNDPSISEGAKDALMAGAQEAGLFAEELAVAVDMQEEYAEMTKLATEAQGEFTDVEKRDAAQAAAGVYRRNYFIGLLERFSQTQEVLNGLVDAGGYSLEENAKAMEALEKKQESLKASVEALAVAIGDAGLEGALKGLADGGTTAINVINDLPKPMKDLLLASTSTFTAVKTLEWGMKTFGIQLPGVSQMIGSLTSGTMSLTSAFKAGATGVSTFVKTNAPLLALSAAVGTIMAITNAVKKQREETEKSIEVFKEQEKTSRAIDELLPKYEELASKTSLTTDEQTELFEIKQKITNLLPDTKDALDNENMSLETQLQIVKDLNEAELERARSKARETLEKHESNYDYYKEEVEESTRIIAEQTAKYEEFYKRRGSLSKKEQTDMRTARLMIDAQSERLEVNRAKVEAVDSARKLHNKSLESSNDLLDENTNITDDNTDSNNANIDSKDSQIKTMEKLIESFNDSTSALQTYYSMLEEVNSKEGLSAQSKQDIISKHQELLPYLGDETELRKHLIEIISREEETQKQAYINMIMASEDYFNSKIKGTGYLYEKLGEFYTKDLENAKSLAEAKAMVEKKLIDELTNLWGTYFNAQAQAFAQMPGTEGMALADMSESDWKGMSESQQKAFSMSYFKMEASKRAAEAFNSIKLDLSSMDFRGINSSGIKGSKADSKGKQGKYENKQLEESLKLLEHRKRLSEETQDTIRAEIAELNRINSLYVRTDEERMSMAERIYSAEKRLRDRMFSDSSKWISDKKAMNELSVEEEIQAWERVKNTHINNLEYRKQAELNLYKLRNQVMADSFSREESSIKHLTKLGILSIDEQIKKYRELYEVKASSLAEEQSRVENLFDLYKKQISDYQKTIKNDHDERIKQIETESKNRIEALRAEADLRKKSQEDVIKGIEKELELLNKQEQEYDHDKKMADLREQLAYWEVRTSEDARKKVIDLKKQIDEANHKREVELQKQGLEEKRQNAQDEIRNEEDKLREKINDIEKATRKEIELAEQSYKEIEIAFDEHSIDMIALASTMSEGMFDEFKKNYLIPLENALRNADYGTVDSILGGIDDFAKDSIDKTYNSNNAQIYRLANQILDLKRQYEYGGDKSASDKAKSIYSQLEKLNPSVADTLHQSNYEQAKKYIEGLPTMHTGGKTLSYGAVYMKPGELVFPPDLSTKLETLISVLYQRPSISPSRSFADNRKETRIGTLLNVENMHMEDDVDSEILVRQLSRAIASI